MSFLSNLIFGKGNNNVLETDSDSDSASDLEIDSVINNNNLSDNEVKSIDSIDANKYINSSKSTNTDTNIYTNTDTNTDTNANTKLNKKNIFIDSNILKSKSLGKTINKTEKYIMRLISIKNLVLNINSNVITIPEFQRDINTNKIKSLLIAFEKNNEIFNYVTNPLQVAYLVTNDCTSLLLIDGQHRYNMYKHLYEQNRIPNHELLINFTKCDTIEEVVNLYLSLNWDNPNIIHLSNEMRIDATNLLMMNRYRNLKNDLAQYKQCWKKNSNVIYDVEEYVAKLIDINFLNDFETNADAIKYILDLNDYYVDYYVKNDVKLLTKLKKDELNLIKSTLDKPYIWTFKNNNFLQALSCSDDIIDDFTFQHYVYVPKTKQNNKIKMVPTALTVTK